MFFTKRQFINARLLIALLGCFGCGSAFAAVEQVVVVFKTHFDIGYTDMASNVVQRYRTTMIDDALKVVDQNRNLSTNEQFTWTLPGWPVSKIIEDWPGQTTDRKQRILQAFKDRRFVVHALPFTTHTELLEPEDLVRGMGFSSRISRSLGLDLPRDAKMTDVPSHSWILPVVLKRAGVDFLHLGCNAASSSPQVPPLFWWEGPDGSRLLTMYTAESYGTGLVPPTNWPHKTWLALIHTGDNHGPPTPTEVSNLLAEAKQKLPGVKVQIGRLSDFGDAILAEKPELPVVRGDMPDTWIHGPMSDPIGAKLARNTRPEITTTEALDTELRAWGLPRPDDAPTIAKAFEQSLLYGEHTWGGAQYWVTAYGNQTKWGYGETWKKDRANGRFTKLEGSWAEHSAYIQTASNLIEPVLEADLHALAQGVKVKGSRIVVYNPLPWKRSGIVTMPIPSSLGGSKITALRALDGRDAVPVEQVDDSTIRFLSPAIPAMGYRTFVPVESAASGPMLRMDAKTGVLENNWLKVAIDTEHGGIRSLFDKRIRRELANSNAPLGPFFYERFDGNNVSNYTAAYVKINADWAFNELGKPAMPSTSDAKYRGVSPDKVQVRFEEGAVSVSAVMESVPSSEIPFGVVTRVTIFRDQPWVELETTLKNKPADPWPEAGWICLPFAVDAPKFRLGRLGSVVDPEKDIVPGCNFDILTLNSGMMIAGSDGKGAGICPIDHPLISLGEPGCFKYTKKFTQPKSRVYVNLFNNQWTTNFRMWNEGTWSSRVRIWGASGDVERDITTPSEEARVPLKAAAAAGAGGDLSITKTGLEISRHGVRVTAFGPDPDGSGLLLRLWENAGRSSVCRVRLPDGLKVQSVQPVDLRGRAVGKPIPVIPDRNGAVFETVLDRYAPASFKLVAQP